MSDLAVQEPEKQPSFQPKRTPGEHDRDLDIIARLHLRGMTEKAIAKEISESSNYTISDKMIHKDIEKIRKMWLDSALVNYDQAKAAELARIDELERAAWEGWNKSLEDKVGEVKERIEDKYGYPDSKEVQTDKKPPTYSRSRRTETTAKSGGDPRFLDTVKWCIEKRCRIFGLDQPTQVRVSWQEEVTKAGLSIDDATTLYNFLISQWTQILTDRYMKTNAIPATVDIKELMATGMDDDEILEADVTDAD